MQDERLKIPTPDFSHLSGSSEFESVYEPAEDTFLLLDAIEAELPDLVRLRPDVCVEVGLGSGVASAALASSLGRNGVPCLSIGTDINPAACKAASATAAAAGASVNVVRTDCLAALSAGLAGRVDVLVCNPPYVETVEEEAGSTGVAAAWAGGKAGRGLTDRVIALCPAALSQRMGRCYIVAEECNRPAEVAEFARGLGLACAELAKRRCGREMLYVLKIERTK